MQPDRPNADDPHRVHEPAYFAAHAHRDLRGQVAASVAGRGRRTVLCLLAAGSLSLATGCGFKLRGATKFSFNSIYLGFAPGSTIGPEFRRAMRIHSDVQVVEQASAAQVRIEAAPDLREKEIVSFSGAGRPREYQLRLRMTFRVVDAQGRELIPWSEMLLRREVTIQDTQLLAKDQEDIILYREMQLEMVERLMLRLGSIRL